MVAVLNQEDIIMNANPASAASVGVSPNTERLQGTPVLDVSVSRAPETTRERDRVRDRAAVTSLDTFDVYRVSLDACRASAPIAASLNANLRDQLLRASSSVVLNIAEGFGSSSRGIKRRHYEIARGSATECIAALDLASVLGTGGGGGLGIREARMLFIRVAMMLAKLAARFRQP